MLNNYKVYFKGEYMETVSFGEIANGLLEGTYTCLEETKYGYQADGVWDFRRE